MSLVLYMLLLYKDYRYLWGQFLPRPSVALVVIFDLESPTLEGWRVPLVWLMPYKVERGRLSFQCGTTKLPKVSTWSSPWPLKQKLSLH